MKKVEDAPDWPMLNKVICAWRDQEEKVRDECGIASITANYEGCTTHTRNKKRRQLRNVNLHQHKPAISAYDILLENELFMHASSIGNTTYMQTLTGMILLSISLRNISFIIAKRLKREDLKITMKYLGLIISLCLT
jgi:hypothetical protein